MRVEEYPTQRMGEIGEGPLYPVPGPARKWLFRRARGITLEILAFILVTLLLPLLLLVGLLVDLYLKLTTGKPMVAIRLVALLWWFLAVEMFAVVAITAIWLRSGGPFGTGAMSRRSGVYWLRPRWARLHLGGFKALFGMKLEIEGLEAAEGAPSIVMIRHASIVDNLLPDTTIALRKGRGIRYVIKRELEALPAIDLGGRWIPTNFLNRGSGEAAAEIARMVELTNELGAAESVLIYPEGTRATAKKIARVKEIVREKQPEVAPLAETMVNLLPPRLGGPLALLERAPDLDVVFFAHAGFDGYQYVSDIWAGGLVGATIKMRLWRVPAAEIPAGEGERAMTEWLYGQWQEVDRWVGEQLAGLDHPPGSGVVAAPPDGRPAH